MSIIGLTSLFIINLIAFVLIFIPLVEFIFKKFKLNIIEIALLSLVISTSLLPLLAWLFNFILPFGYILVSLSIFVPLSLSLYLVLSRKVDLSDFFNRKIELHSWIILAIFVFAFVYSITSLSSYFYEFDPYYYSFMNWFLITKGSIPMSDSWVYASTETITHGGETYNLRLVGHRNLFVPQYLGSIWYLLGFGQKDDLNLIKYVADLYPPLSLGLLAFMVYFVFGKKYDKKLALISALFIVLVPYLSSKFVAGVSEQLPWGLYIGITSVLFTYIVFENVSENKWLYPLIIVLYLGALMGSKAGMIPYVVLSLYTLAKLSIDFIYGSRSKTLYEVPLLISVFSILIQLLFSVYIGMFYVPIYVYMLLFVGIVAFIIYHMMDIFKNKLKTINNRGLAVSFLGVFLILFLISPLGSPFVTYAKSVGGVAGFEKSNALQKTVAEENLNGNALSDRFGVLGKSINVNSLNDMIFGKYGALYLLPVIFILNLFVLLVAIIRKDYTMILLLSVLIYSMGFVGLQKVKYLPHLAAVLVLSFGVVLGEVATNVKKVKVNSLDYYIVYGVIFALALFYLIPALLMNLKIATNLLVEATDLFEMVNIVYLILFVGIVYVIYLSLKDIKNHKINYNYLSIALLALFVIQYFVMAIDVLQYLPSYALVNGTDYQELSNFCGELNDKHVNSYVLQKYCPIIPQYWYDAMMWLRKNMDNESYLLSWWDYGHWTNFYARKRTVTRNDHPFVILDLEVADKYVNATPQELADYMKMRNSTYVLFDMDLVGKWGALTYLSCVYNGDTSSTELPSESKCAAEHLFETILVPMFKDINTICKVDNNYGLMSISTFGRKYCVILSGKIPIVFDYNTRKQLPIYLIPQGKRDNGGKPFGIYIALYDKDHLDEAPGKGYNSNFYRAFVLGDLPGFEQVYPEDEKGLGVLPIRIYKRIN